MAFNTKEVLTNYHSPIMEQRLMFTKVPPSPGDPTATAASKDVTVSSSVSARVHIPKLSTPAEKLPILVYFHGGGFCIGSAFSASDSHYMTLLSGEARAIAISVEYRLAPEHPLPAAYEDSWTALNWVCAHAVDDESSFQKEAWILNHGDFSKISVGGDSAGGNIAHNLTMRVGSEPLPGNLKISGCLLSHPAFLGSKLPGSGAQREPNIFDGMWEFAYPSCPGGIDDPRINPIADGAPSLSGLGCQKVLVCVAEKDPFTPWGLAYVEHLKRSGWTGEAETVEVEGEDHCFHAFDPEVEKARDLIKRMACFIST